MTDTIELMERAMQRFQAGDTPGAEADCQQALAVERDNPDALYLLGVIEHGRGNGQLARTMLERAIAIEGGAFWYHAALAEVRAAYGDRPGAIDSLIRAIELDRSQPQLFDALAMLVTTAGLSRDQQVEVWLNLTERVPDNALALNCLATSLTASGRATDAISVYQKALALEPNLVLAVSGLADALLECRRVDEAQEAIARAVQLAPNDPYVLHHQAVVLTAVRKYDEARAIFDRVLRMKPDLLEARFRLAQLLSQQGEVQAAIDQHRQILQAAPKHQASRYAILMLMNYLPDATPQEVFDAHRGWAAEFPDPVTRQFARPHSNTPEENRTIRVGYLSTDFRRHAVSMFFQPILENHRRAQVQAVCFADVRQPDDVTAALRARAAGWHSVRGMNADQIAELIRFQGIDVLVDLTGHSSGGSFNAALALKPAPVQINYLGYCNTSGMEAVDYFVGDAITDPPDDTQPYAEQLIRLPNCFTCYQPRPGIDPNELPAASRGHVTFGAFQALAKLNPRVLDLWSRLLREVPSSKLLIIRDRITPNTSARLAREFAARGIGEDRLRFQSELPEEPTKLAIYHEVDISLDPFPWTGHTTSCNSMWMGVPIVTLRGRTHAGRMTASTVTHAGFPEFVAESEEDYIRIAASLASDLPKLAELRHTMRSRMAASKLRDAGAFIIDWERALRDAWRKWCASSRARR